MRTCLTDSSGSATSPDAAPAAGLRRVPGPGVAPALVAVLAAVSLTTADARQAAEFDLVIRGGTVIDGSGAPGVSADVAVRNGRILRVGRVAAGTAARDIDARGLVVAPGFIDVHTHADELADRAAAANYVRMGVTTVVAGNCGGSAANVGKALALVASTPVAVNFATLVGHNDVREAVMGRARRAPTAEELGRMKTLVETAMKDGAIGLSTGLQYVPGVYADRTEIIELAKVVGALGGVYATHLRNEGTAVDDAVAEAIAIGEAAGCPVQISHLKIDSPNRWGASADVLRQIDRARARGVRVGADQYAYTAAASSLSIRFPAWALEGGRERIRERLTDEPTWRKIKEEIKGLLAERGIADLGFAVVASYKADPSFNGLSIKQVAARVRGADTADDQFEAARQILLGGDASMVYHFMSEDDVKTIMRHPQVSVASDSDLVVPGQGVPHPRSYGNTVRVLGRYVRELKVIPIEEAVRKMTSLPASQLGLGRRGLVREGYPADLVVFDPSTVADRATFDQPHQYPIGVLHVLVNGVVVVDSGTQTTARPGTVLRRGDGGSASGPAAQAGRGVFLHAGSLSRGRPRA